VGWHEVNGGGMSTETKNGDCFGFLPRDIVTRFFAPWLAQNGINTSNE
jgi:hypothetical protein